jgi:NADH pyrophosphatase NudC (nudix superfamily)
MGRTVLPFSRVLEQEVFEEARLHVQAGVYASRPWPFETILISILLEHEKTLVELRSKLRILEEKE